MRHEGFINTASKTLLTSNCLFSSTAAISYGCLTQGWSLRSLTLCSTTWARRQQPNGYCSPSCTYCSASPPPPLPLLLLSVPYSIYPLHLRVIEPYRTCKAEPLWRRESTYDAAVQLPTAHSSILKTLRGCFCCSSALTSYQRY